MASAISFSAFKLLSADAMAVMSGYRDLVHLDQDLAHRERPPAEPDIAARLELGQPHDRELGVGAADREPEVYQELPRKPSPMPSADNLWFRPS